MPYNRGVPNTRAAAAAAEESEARVYFPLFLAYDIPTSCERSEYLERDADRHLILSHSVSLLCLSNDTVT